MARAKLLVIETTTETIANKVGGSLKPIWRIARNKTKTCTIKLSGIKPYIG